MHFVGLGVRLTFRPAITGSGSIRLLVRPELRTIDTAHGAAVNGFKIPGIATCGVEADVELNAGQSFLISGLMDDAVREMLSKMPDLVERDPILSAIFGKGDQGKGDIVIIVTSELFGPQIA